MTKQEVIDAVTAMAASLETIKESTTNARFFGDARPILRDVNRKLVALRDTPDE